MKENPLLWNFHFMREESEFVIRHVSEHEEKGFVIYSNLDEQNIHKAIQEEVARFQEAKQGFEWKVYSRDSPANFKENFKANGFTCEDPEALMVIELTKDHLLLGEDTSQICEIKDGNGIKVIVGLEDAIWDESHEDLGIRLWRDKKGNPEGLFIYGIYEEKQLVSAAWMYKEGKSFASLWGGATLPNYRGNGFYPSLKGQ
ncbi:N-acetyltransferase [Pseudalkalibacillus hwajinpoensis]|uniref:N-acetyltransferase n=1 Tax=Guptibacillus hwajinpoensis TaxID=208199 RepID=UPI00325B75A3